MKQTRFLKNCGKSFRYQLAERQFPRFDFFHGVIWFEAQVKGGKDDEEWGLAVFEYLMERDLRKNPEHAVRVPPNDYLLYDNMVARNTELGRIAKARCICMFMEDSLKRNHFDTSGASYEDQGPIFSFLPHARKRRFPIFAHELPKSGDAEPENQEFIYYPNITRIETYDAVTGKLLAIDANGDGDFLDSGDMIAADSNRNSCPELVFGKDQKLASLMMYVQPPGDTAGDVELAIRILTEGEWHTDAIDVIKPYRRAGP